MCLAFIAGLLLLSGLDSRLLMASGFVFIAVASYLNADLTSAWSASNYYRTELLMGLGQCFAFVGLVATIILQGIFSGGLSKPQWILTFSAFFHVVRLFGGELGAVYMGHFVAQREKLHSNLLGLHVQRRELDHRRKYPGAHGGSVFKILRIARRRRPGGRTHGRQITAASLHAEHNRWILPGGLGERRRSAAHCLASQVTADLRQPQRPCRNNRPRHGRRNHERV